MDNKVRLLEICAKALSNKGLLQDKRYTSRLENEMTEIEVTDEFDYFLDLYNRKVKYNFNEHNSLVAWLLDIVDDYDIEKEHAFDMGEFPDIDVDYQEDVRNYLKTEWAPKRFGRENVCSIGNYTTFGIKSAVKDMARVFSLDRGEVEVVAKQIELKDADGKPISWDKALEECKPFAEYCEMYPEAMDAARKLVDRNRGRGVHAGGLIVSQIPISDFVPLVIDKEGNAVSAWPEGQHRSDLSPVGLIKFDLLVIKLMQIASCCKYISQRHGLTTICAGKNGKNWSDLGYLNDPKALALANEGRMIGVFQFDSPGIRELVKAGGVTSFDDIPAYSALYRPGCLQQSMDKAYVNRKKGREPYEIHDILKPILGTTYNVMVFQEQIMEVLNKVGNIPKRSCEVVRKAISKKKDEVIEKCKDQFIQNGQEVLGETEEYLRELFDLVQAFSAYGFNKSHSYSYGYISARQLYLKAHYPIEFFCALLENESDADKIKIYKQDAKDMGVEVRPLDINKSKENFSIDDEEGVIYIGFGNIKGIGESPAKRIVENQPYASFEDFLSKFGTDSNTIKPLLGLRVFEGDPDVLNEYYEMYKAVHKSRSDRDKRYHNTYESNRQMALDVLKRYSAEEASIEEFMEQLLRIPYSDIKTVLPMYMLEWKEKMAGAETFLSPDDEKTFVTLIKKMVRSSDGYNKKIAMDKSFTLANFEPSTNDKSFSSKLKCERDYYGFEWETLVELSPDYDPDLTFQRFNENDDVAVAYVQVRVASTVKEYVSKKNTKYYRVIVEDGNGQKEPVTIWEDDFARFEDEFRHWHANMDTGNLLSLQLRGPSAGYNSYTLYSPAKWNRHREVPEDKALDMRVISLRMPEQKVLD